MKVRSSLGGRCRDAQETGWRWERREKGYRGVFVIQVEDRTLNVEGTRPRPFLDRRSRFANPEWKERHAKVYVTRRFTDCDIKQNKHELLASNHESMTHGVVLPFE